MRAARLSENLKLFPNQITLVRLLMVPVMWALALLHMPEWIGIGLIVCFISDALDGHTARTLNQVTEFGGKFDSLADNLLIPSALVWLMMLRPEVFADRPFPALAAIGTYLVSITVGWIKFRRFGNLHLYLSKASGAVQYVFIIHALSSSSYNLWLYYFTVGVFFLSSLETLVLQLVRTDVSGDLKSILFCFGKGSRSPTM